MSTLADVIQLVDEVKPNAFSTKAKVIWLNMLDRKIAVNVLLLSEADARQIRYSEENLEVQLLADSAFEDMYSAWLQAQIDFQNGEYEKYQNTMSMYNAIYSEYVQWYAMTYDPAQDNLGQDPRCYLTAYALAVKAGFSGTVEQWLASLKGEKGDPGDMIASVYDPQGKRTDIFKTISNHAANKGNPHGVTAEQVGARPNTWTPTANEVGARPATWMPTAADVGALPLDGSKAMTGNALKLFNGAGALTAYSNNAGFLAYKTPDDASNMRSLSIWSNENIKSSLTLRDYVDGQRTQYTVLHTGNKPSGSYTGNGSAVGRTIETGGIGSVIALWGSNYWCIISPYGAIAVEQGLSVTSLSLDLVKFENGRLTIVTNSAYVNKNGVTYTYQVL